jgi:hypothetical protein
VIAVAVSTRGNDTKGGEKDDVGVAEAVVAVGGVNDPTVTPSIDVVMDSVPTAAGSKDDVVDESSAG